MAKAVRFSVESRQPAPANNLNRQVIDIRETERPVVPKLKSEPAGKADRAGL